MTVSEADALDEALVTALSLLQAGTSEEQRGLLAVPMATALLRPSLSMLWACVIEQAEAGAQNVTAFGEANIKFASSIAGALFASAFE